MAKGVHSKRTKRNKQIKRKALWECKLTSLFISSLWELYLSFLVIQKKEHTEQSNRLMKRTYGQGDDGNTRLIKRMHYE